MLNKPIIVLMIIVSFFLIGCTNQIAIKNTTKVPVNNLNGESFIKNWIIAGPFPSPTVEKALPDGSYHLGFYKDYLEEVGGELSAELTEGMVIKFSDKNNKDKQISCYRHKANILGFVDFDKIYNKVDYKVAYAYSYLYSKTEQTAHFFLGSDDGVKVWVNGELVHKNDAARGINYRQDKFSVKLKKGQNKILIKVNDLVRDWAFVLETMDNKSYAEYIKADLESEAFKDFLNCKLIPKGNPWDISFTTGKFLEMRWDNPYVVEKAMGNFPIEVQWFDKDYNEVKFPENPGRYAYYGKGITSSGITVRRAGTLFCSPSDWLMWSQRPKAELQYIPNKYFDKKAWIENQKFITDFTGRKILLSMLGDTEGAILLSYLYEMESTGETPKMTETPLIKDHEFHLGIKRKIFNLENKWPDLKPPEKINNAATILHSGTEKVAGFKPGTANNIKKLCKEWFNKSEVPFDLLVSRNGVIIIHEAFGEDASGKFTLDQQTPMASLTKLLTGVMFAQFIDQGLINIDDPVGKYLPDFPVTGDKAMTFRNCFTHTCGLDGHAAWGGLHNPWLENVIANQLPKIVLNKYHNYNGMGYDLAGRGMEIVSGKSVFRLMRENLFDPLEMYNTTLEEDLGFSCQSTAGDFAKIGQLLLNKGSYGNLKFFSSETFEKLTPKPLNNYYKGLSFDWGIGLTWMHRKHPESNNGDSEFRYILSKNIIGHGSATSAVLQVDLDNNIVIAQTRKQGGKDYDKYLEKLLMTIEEGLIK